jgi:hypothetical protein
MEQMHFQQLLSWVNSCSLLTFTILLLPPDGNNFVEFQAYPFVLFSATFPVLNLFFGDSNESSRYNYNREDDFYMLFKTNKDNNKNGKYLLQSSFKYFFIFLICF